MYPSTEPAIRHRRRGAALVFAAVMLAAGVPSAPSAAPRVEPFDAEVWSRLKSTLPRPAVVVFTTSYCATCPEVFEGLGAEIRMRRPGAPLVAVVLDGESLGRRPREAHLARADRLFVFRGQQEAALRHAVDPSWRGVTPWVALIGADGAVTFGGGTPTRDRLETWARGEGMR